VIIVTALIRRRPQTEL